MPCKRPYTVPCEIDQNVTCTVARLCVVLAQMFWRVFDSSHDHVLLSCVCELRCVVTCVAPVWGVGRTVELRNYRGEQLSTWHMPMSAYECPMRRGLYLTFTDAKRRHTRAKTIHVHVRTLYLDSTREPGLDVRFPACRRVFQQKMGLHTAERTRTRMRALGVRHLPDRSSHVLRVPHPAVDAHAAGCGRPFGRTAAAVAAHV
jgi:hypothetical protein